MRIIPEIMMYIVTTDAPDCYYHLLLFIKCPNFDHIVGDNESIRKKSIEAT